jgi:hypothetical protein
VLLNDGVVHFAENVTVLDEVQLIQLQGWRLLQILLNLLYLLLEAH